MASAGGGAAAGDDAVLAAVAVERPDGGGVDGLDAAEAEAAQHHRRLRAPAAAVLHCHRVLRLPLHHPPRRPLRYDDVRRPAALLPRRGRAEGEGQGDEKNQLQQQKQREKNSSSRHC
uniref:Uncharacterized protein n=1 Tax=Ananas comosus var. bracteatus TaxID=296719 RepID=A0A6V7Q0S1_ANACO|nr:unnamed protein product [Ananas comosus var. bracteatus]